jgi:hypothetical protein
MPRYDRSTHFAGDIVESQSSSNQGFHVSADGTRVEAEVHNVWPRKSRRRLNDLGDEYADWTPVPEDDLDGVHAVADTVTSFDISPDDETVKRKRYASSVRHFHFS